MSGNSNFHTFFFFLMIFQAGLKVGIWSKWSQAYATQEICFVANFIYSRKPYPSTGKL